MLQHLVLCFLMLGLAQVLMMWIVSDTIRHT